MSYPKTDQRPGNDLDDQQPIDHYRLNSVLVMIPQDSTLVVGQQPYRDQGQLHELRDRVHETHLVKRSGETINCIAFAKGGETIGNEISIKAADRPDFVQRLLSEWLVRSLASQRVTRGKGGVIRYTSDRKESNILNDILPSGVQVPDGIGRRIAADFDVRKVRGKSGKLRVVVCIDIKTRITIDCPLSTLVKSGFNPLGFYVQRDVESMIGAHRRLTGRIQAIDGATLILDDHDDGFETLPMADAWLEPRAENLEQVMRAIVGSRWREMSEKLNDRVSERIGGSARLKLIDDWVKKLRSLPNDIAQGVCIGFDQTVMRADGPKFPHYELYERPQLVFDVGLTKTDTSNQSGLDHFGPYNFEQFPKRRINLAIICQASRQGDVERFVQQLLEGKAGSQWARKGLLRRYRLEKPTIRTFIARSPKATDYQDAVAAAIDDATNRNEKWHLAFVQTDEASHNLRGDENPYLLTKALFLEQQVPSQAFEWESIAPGVYVDATINNIGLASYAKLGGVPWLLPVHQAVARELVVGLGSFESMESRIGGREKYIGVSTVFSASGRYFLESRTPATPAAEYVPALLSALRRSIGEIRATEGWSENDRVRLIFHVFKDLNNSEIDAVKTLMAELRLPHAEFAFIHLVQNHPYMLFDPTQEGVGRERRERRKGVTAPPRGLRVDLGKNEALVCLRGAAELRKASDGVPKPMLLRLHPDSTFKDLSYLARQIYDFTFLSWRNLYSSSRPITVHYADLVASLLVRLREVSFWNPITILGPVGRERWFL